ncbi:DNA-directed DNA polymerase, partial [Tanacetum coccineum]
MLVQDRKKLREQYSQIFSTINKRETPKPEAPTFAITTRSGISTQDPPFPALPRPATDNFTEGETKREGPEGVEPNIIQEPAPQPSILYQPSKSSNLPFSSRLKKQKKDDEDEWLLLIFKQIHINMSFLEAMIHMPKGAKVLKDLLSHKEKLKKAASSVKLSEECSAIIQRSLPQKEGDPGSFTLPCLIGPLAVNNALADLGASINLMPHSLFRQLGISKLKPTKMSIQLADRSIKYPIGRPFLAMARAIIDVHEGKLSLRVRSKTVTFNIGKSMKSKHSRDDYLYCADHTAKLVQEQCVDIVDHDGEWTEEEEGDDPNKVFVVSFYPRTEPMKPLEWKALENQLKPSSAEPPKLELKELPKHLELLEVLRNHKGAITWSIVDIRGFDSSLCTHKILMEDEFKPSVQLQRRVNPNIKEVVPKKGGMTVVKNENDELILQRTITRWRMLERLDGHEYYYFLDGFYGYLQILIAPEDQEKTTFTCPYGTFAYKRMSFGLCNAPTTFQRCMTTIFHELIEDSMEEFDIEISDKKGAESLAADHLSQLENPDLGKLTSTEIRDLFLKERLMAISNKNDEPWAIEMYDDEGSEFIVNKQRVKPYQKNVLDTNRDDDITLDDEGEVT